MQDKLAAMRANPDELRPGGNQWRSRAERILMDRREPDSGGSAG
jgi:hypothetical protein